MNREQTRIKPAITMGGKIITIAAFAVATVSVYLPIVAHIMKVPLNLIWPDFLAIALMVVAGYLFREYQKEKNIVKLCACHLLLCIAMVSSNMIWAGALLFGFVGGLWIDLSGMASLGFAVFHISFHAPTWISR